MIQIANQQTQSNNDNESERPRVIIIYKTYTEAVKRAQIKYRGTIKGKLARQRAKQAFRARHRDRLLRQRNAKVECPHCGCVYSKGYLKSHIKKKHKSFIKT